MWHNFLLWKCGSSGQAAKNYWFLEATERVQKSCIQRLGKSTGVILSHWQECAITLTTVRVWQLLLLKSTHWLDLSTKDISYVYLDGFLILPSNKLNWVAWSVEGRVKDEAWEVFPDEQSYEQFYSLTSWEFWTWERGRRKWTLTLYPKLREGYLFGDVDVCLNQKLGRRGCILG